MGSNNKPPFRGDHAGSLLRSRVVLAARSQPTPYNRLACQLACEQIGLWDMEQELTHRLVNTYRIGCNLGQDHCL